MSGTDRGVRGNRDEKVRQERRRCSPDPDRDPVQAPAIRRPARGPRRGSFGCGSRLPAVPLRARGRRGEGDSTRLALHTVSGHRSGWLLVNPVVGAFVVRVRLCHGEAAEGGSGKRSRAAGGRGGDRGRAFVPPACVQAEDRAGKDAPTCAARMVVGASSPDR